MTRTVEYRRTVPPTDLVTLDRCYICRRRPGGVDEGGVNVTMDGAVRNVCSTCWERGQDEIRIPLDMTEDDDGD